jgi:molybdenum cofactor cytidylyltransferase
VIVALVLAAGKGTRFGGPKVLAPLAGVPVVRHATERICQAAVDRVIVVAGKEHDRIGRAVSGLPVQLVVNPDPEAGMAASLRTGLLAVPQETEAILVALGDQPLVDPGLVDRMVAAWRGNRGRIVVPEYGGERGNPVLFDASLRPELMLVEGDRGARGIIDKHDLDVYRLRVDGPPPLDVDNADDLAALERQLAAGAR